MNEHPTPEDLLNSARQIKEMESDLVPVMFYWGQKESVINMLAGEIPLSEQVGAAAQYCYREAGPLQWVAVVADAYYTPLPTKAKAGSLAEMFEAGDMNVAEQIMVLSIEANGRPHGLRQVYRHTPADGWEWDDPEPFDDVTGLGSILELAAIEIT